MLSTNKYGIISYYGERPDGVRSGECRYNWRDRAFKPFFFSTNNPLHIWRIYGAYHT